jgi:hypothetical protein
MTTTKSLHEIAAGSDDKYDVQHAVFDKLVFIEVQHQQPLTHEVPNCLDKVA